MAYIQGTGTKGDGVKGGPSPLWEITALPMDTTTLQSAQATAGVRADRRFGRLIWEIA